MRPHNGTRFLENVLRRCDLGLRRAQVELTGIRITVAAHNSTSRPGDLFIASYPKSGTTWLQMIVYQLATDGKMEFSHISQVSPSLESALLKGADAFAASTSGPFKTHLMPSSIPTGAGRCIYIIRHGLDVATSYYHHYCRYNNYKGSFDAFFSRFLTQGSLYPHCNWFTHVAAWIRNVSSLNVMVVRYEDLARDTAGTIVRIARVCGHPVDTDILTRTLARCSFDFMRAHEDKFDPMPHINCTGGPDSHFIRRGLIGESKVHVTENMLKRYCREFDRSIGVLGFPEYRRLPESLEDDTMEPFQVWKGQPGSVVDCDRESRRQSQQEL